MGSLRASSPKAPAATLSHFAAVAREEVQPGLCGERAKHNASRDSHSFINRWGLAWKVPLSYVDAEIDGENVKFAYIKPKAFLEFLGQKAPELLMGGCQNLVDGKAQLKSFWEAYYHVHPSHRIFNEHHGERSFDNTVSLALHGDEGRGLRKANTTILMMETCIGIDTWSNVVCNKNALDCRDCTLDEPAKKRLRIATTSQSSTSRLAGYQSTNLKQHSFLTKFVLAALPLKQTDLLNTIMTEIARDFNALFDTGFLVGTERFFAAATGSKGDLKWVQHIAGLQRGFASQIAVNKPMCHECMAGDVRYPFEDSNHIPAWAQTCYTERPFSTRPIICHVPFEFEHGNDGPAYERFFRRDIFHNTKMGVFRDFVASSVMLLMRLQYFNVNGESNARDVCLNRAYFHFRWFCKTTNRTPSLRSFSLSFFNSPTWNVFPWVNCKGSDTSHLLAWVHTMVTGYMNAPLRAEHAEVLLRICLTAKAGREFQRMSYSHHLWMSKTCAGAMYNELHAFVRNYNACAFLSLNQFHYTGFGMKSKFHLICHQKLDILRMLQNGRATLVPSIQMYGCEMNEDVVGKISRLIRRVSARLASARALQLYLIKCKVVHRRFLKQQKKLTLQVGRSK